MNLYNNGWQVIKSEDKKSLSLLKKKVFEQAKKVFKYNPKNIDDGLDNFHKYLKNLKDTELNEKKVKLIKKISTNKILVNLLFKSFEQTIKDLIGNDILVQKTINLVIQPPKDNNPTIPHRDAPPNSFYEVVVWIPLTNCYETKSMYVVNANKSKQCINILKKNDKNWSKLIKEIQKNKIYPKVNYGEALFFMTNIYHGSDTNITNETRFSLNIRFKNLFTPSGKKFPLHFFRPYQISEFTKYAIKRSKEENEN